MNDEYSSLAQASQDWHAPTGFESTDSPSRSSRSLPAHGLAVKPSTCAAPGRTVIDRMGLLNGARAIGLEQAGMSWVDALGQTRAAMPTDAFGGEGFISEIEILRGDLVDLFYRQFGDGIEWIFNDTITELAQSSNCVNVTFRGPRPALRFRHRRRRLTFSSDGRIWAGRGLRPSARPARHGSPLRRSNSTTGISCTTTAGLVASIWSQLSESKAALSFRTRPGERVGYDRRDRASCDRTPGRSVRWCRMACSAAARGRALGIGFRSMRWGRSNCLAGGMAALP